MIAAIFLLGIGTCIGMTWERFRPNGTYFWREAFIDAWDDMARPDGDQTVVINEWDRP